MREREKAAITKERRDPKRQIYLPARVKWDEGDVLAMLQHPVNDCRTIQ